MAEVNSSNLSPADLHRESDTSANYYAGTKAQLVAAGLCKAEWFPKVLTLEFCKDGRPKLGNSGRQRVKRVYPVEGSDPVITLTHRTDPEKREYWWVRILVSDAEREKREAALHAAREEEQGRLEAADRKREANREAERYAAEPIVSQLRSRYPGLLIRGSVSGSDGEIIQSLTFHAPDLATLQRSGLVTPEMLDERNRKSGGDWYSGDLPDGRGFFISKNGSASDWFVALHTHEVTRYRKRIPVTEARRVLKEIAAASRRPPS